MTDFISHPPIAKTEPFSFEHLGRTFTDPYAWLQNKHDPAVIAYLEAENAYAAGILSPRKDLQEQLFLEMKGRIKEEDISVPYRQGDYFYYTRTEAGKQYKLFCRKHLTLDAAEEILLDENALAQGLAYCRVGLFEPSPDNALAAYSVDRTGAWSFDLFVMDLASKEILLGPIPQTAYNLAWASDSRTLFYILFDDSHRPYKLMRHILGEAASAEIYHEADDSFNLRVRRTRSGEYLLLTAHSHSTTEVRYLPANRPGEAFKLIHPRQHWMEYYVEHHGERFLIRCNEEAPNFKLLEAPVVTPGKENWQEIVPYRANTLLEDVEAFKDFLVLWERRDGLQQIRISAPDGVSQVYSIPFPDPAYALNEGENRDFNAQVLRFNYTSLVTPNSTIDFGLADHHWEVVKLQEIPSGYEPGNYRSERIYATAPDGVQVPISLFYRKDIKRDGSAPLLLHGYGSYGASIDPEFDPKRLSLVDRGFVYGVAHIRGGSELGRDWYENGRLMNKKNTFTDFIACTEHLIAQGYTHSERLAIIGTSAGGLLVSAVANMRPDLFQAVVARVPFTNVITAMLDRNLPLTVPEWEQWGHPDNPQAFDYMLSYSPYDNIEAKAYPHFYVTAGLNDLQVPYWDPAKWVAKLRAHKTDRNLLLLVTHMGAGHGGSSGRYDFLREWAKIYAFLVDIFSEK